MGANFYCIRKFAFVFLVAFSASVYASPDFSVQLDAGRLRLNAATPMAQGSLLILIRAGGDSAFSNSLAPGQYVSGNDVMLSAMAFPMSAAAFNNGGGPEETSNFLTNLPNLPANVGDLIALRWFPQITYQQFLQGVTPSAGQNFGTYNPLADGNANNNPDVAFDPNSSPWSVPSGSANINLDFFTTDTHFGGTQAPFEGYASFTVVPEPATCFAGVLGAGAIGLSLIRRRFKR
jgi:hypothetical protein